MKEISLDIPYKKAWNVLNKEDKAFVKKRLGGCKGSCEYVTLVFQFEEKDEVSLSSPTSFNIVWDLYDKKVGRAMCEKLWARLPKAEKELALLHIPKYVAATPDKQYRKNFSTYIRQQGWRDEIIDKSDGREQRIKELAEHLTSGLEPDNTMPF